MPRPAGTLPRRNKATKGGWWLFFLYDQDQALASAADPRDAKSSSHLFDDCSRPHARSHVHSPGQDGAKPTLTHGAASWSCHGKNPPLCLSPTDPSRHVPAAALQRTSSKQPRFPQQQCAIV